MARRVRCSVTKESGDPTDFIKINGKYYKNQEVYEQFKAERELSENFYNKIAKLLGYDNFRNFTGNSRGLLMKKIKDSKLTIRELYDSLIEKEEYINGLFGEITEHTSDNNRVLGLFKIIETIPESITYGGCYEIKNKNREKEKHNTLYLECAYYLKYVHNKIRLYNTVNPYIALKENSVSLENYEVDCKKVLELLLEDKENILPAKTKKLIEKDLKQ